MQLIDVLIEAETQRDVGADPDEVERTLTSLREVEPNEPRPAQPARLKLVPLRVQDVFGRVLEH